MSTSSHLRRSPAGVYVTDVQRFLASRDSEPVGSSVECRGWAAQGSSMFPPGFDPDLASLFVFNKTRGRQRVCPACRRLYHIGDGIGGKTLAQGSTEREEQALSGICCYPCAVVMGVADMMGKSADVLNQSDYDQIFEKRGALPQGIRFFRVPPEEEAAFGGLQVVVGTQEDYDALRNSTLDRTVG